MIVERFPIPQCWSCVECTDEGNKLFKEFVVSEIENGHIYHRMKPNEADSCSGDASNNNS